MTAAGGCAKENVFERRLSADAIGLAKPREHITGQRGHLDRHEEHQQIGGAGHEAHTQRRPSSSVKNSGPSPSCIFDAVVENHIRMMPIVNSNSISFHNTAI